MSVQGMEVLSLSSIWEDVYFFSTFLSADHLQIDCSSFYRQKRRMEAGDDLSLVVIANTPYEAGNKGKSQTKLNYLSTHQ